jgi:hypothetical protein
MRRLREALDTPSGRGAARPRPARSGRPEAWISEVAEPIVDQLWDVARIWEYRKERHREERRQRKVDERVRRQALKRAERRAHRRAHTRGEGYVQLVAAVVLALFAAFNPDLWWLIFVALGVGTQGVRVLATSPEAEAGERSGAESEAEDARPGRGDRKARKARASGAPPEPEDPRDARVDAVCARILAELAASPEGVRDLGSRPEQTIEALRSTCRELTRRERELRALTGPDDDRRLAAEREQLVARIAGEEDAIVRQRLEGALQALDGQQQQRRELSVSAARFEAEHTRLGYTLEGMYTQLLRVRSADAVSRDLAGAGLRQSVEQLGEEIDAVAQALEEVNRGDLTPLSPIDADAPRAAPGSQRQRS